MIDKFARLLRSWLHDDGPARAVADCGTEGSAHYWACWEQCTAKGLAAQQQGEREEAQRHFLNALNDLQLVWARSGGREPLGLDPRRGATFARLGDVYGADGAYALLAHTIERASEKGQALGDHADVAAVIAFGASLYRGIGGKIPGTAGGPWKAMAYDLDQRALHIRERALGPWHLSVAESLDTITGQYSYKFGAPEKLRERAQAIREKVLGPNDAAVILGRVRGGRADEAALRDALTALEHVVGDDDPRRAGLLERLADTLRGGGRTIEAGAALRDALAMRERSQGGWHPDVGETLLELAGIYSMEGRTDEAERLYMHAIDILRRAAGIDDPAMQDTREIFEFVLPPGDVATEAPPGLRRISVVEDRCWLVVAPTGEEQPGHPPAPLMREERSLAIVLERPGLSASNPGSTILARLASAMEWFAVLLDETNRHDEARRLEARAGALHYGVVRGVSTPARDAPSSP